MAELKIQQDIPKGWVVKKMDDFINEGAISLGRGEVISKEDIKNFPGENPIYSSSVKNNGLFGRYAKNMFDQELITWSVDGGGDFFYRPRHKFSVTNVSGYMNVDEKEFDYKFLAYYLQEEHSKKFFDYQHKAHPSVIRELYVVAKPPIKEQQKIAEILGTVDEEIAKTQEVIEATEKLKRGLMQQLFTRGIGHTKFKETEFGRIPDEWEVKELKDVSIKIGDGLHGTPEYSDGSEYYFINGNNIYERGIKIYPETKKISVEQHQLHKKELTSRSILLSINGTIGNIGFYRGEKVALGKSIAYINCDDEINKEFVAYQLETQRIYKYFAKELTGTTIKNLSLGTIRQMPVFVPKKEEQQRIANILSTIDEKISVNKKLKEKFTLLKKGLMQDLLSGRVRAKL